MADNSKEVEKNLDEPILDPLPDRFTYGAGDLIIKLPENKN